MEGSTRSPAPKAVEIHEVLSNERRRLILESLREAGGSLSAKALSERIAEAETGESPPPSNIRQSAYVAIHQTHLPKLDDMEIVEYDQDSKTVELDHRAEEVNVYMETVPKYGLTWSEFYVGLGILGLLLVIAGEIGVPVIAAIGSLPMASGVLLLIAGTSLYRIIVNRSSIVHRLRG